MTKIADGWISIKEMDFIKSFMRNNTGNILEIGAANGRLFSYLYATYPNWNYTAVDPWSFEKVRLQSDYDKHYNDDVLGKIITEKDFQKNCPFAKSYDMYFENFNTDKKFDIISIGANKRNLSWNQIYKKAFNMLDTNGIIIGRNLNHFREGVRIKKTIKKYFVSNYGPSGSFTIERKDNE